MIFDRCAITMLPVRNGDQVVCLMPSLDSVHLVWDGSHRARRMAEVILCGSYQDGWVSGYERPSTLILFASIFVHRLAWDRLASFPCDDGRRCDEGLSEMHDELGRVVHAAWSIGISMTAVRDTKEFRDKFSLVAWKGWVDILDQLAQEKMS